MIFTSRVFQVTAFRSVPIDLLGRITAVVGSGDASPIPTEGNLINQGDITSISVAAYVNGRQISTTKTPSASSIIFNTLQTGGIWGLIDQGGNAKYKVPSDLLDNESATVRIVILFRMTDGSDAPWIVDVAIEQQVPLS